MTAPFTVRSALERVREAATPDDPFREWMTAIREKEEGSSGLNAFLSLTDPGVELPEGRPEGQSLRGVPVAVKDNLATRDLPTTCASRILEGYRSPFEATAVRRLREAGARVVGKTNMDEFGMGSSTENSAFGPARNPWNRERVPGGSSGGSAAAVAAGYVPAALGSDTGGSIRQPAAFCGVVGFKPTYGRVSRYGLVAYASSLDQVGTFGRTVEDAARVLEVISGHDPRDATSARRDPVRLLPELESGVRDLVVGVPEEYFHQNVDPGVGDACERALAVLEKEGARVRSVSLPSTRYGVSAYYLIAPAEASSNLARYDGVRFGSRADGAASTREVYEGTRARGFGREVVRRILLGTFALSAGYYDAYYGRAQRVRGLVARELRQVFASGVDFLFTPTSPSAAFPLGERVDDPVRMYQSDVFTVTANLAGIPALSVPVGTADGLPVGGQLLGPHWQEGRLARAAWVLEQAMNGGGG